MVTFVSNQWFDYPVTNPHLTDDGEDIGTPSGTAVYFPDKTKIEDTSWHDYGGQVVGDVSGSGWSEYFIHLRDITVQPGRTYPAGTVIGHTGGGIGDNVLHGGRVQPAQSQSWYNGHSSGPHTEFGIFRGEDMAAFNQGWGNKSREKDPAPLVSHLHATQGAGVGSGGDGLTFLGIALPGSNAFSNNTSDSSSGDLFGIAGAITGLGTSIGQSAAKAQTDIAAGAKRAGFFVLGGAVLVAGALILILPAATRAVEGGVSMATGAGQARQALRQAPRPQPQPTQVTHIHPISQPTPQPAPRLAPRQLAAPTPPRHTTPALYGSPVRRRVTGGATTQPLPSASASAPNRPMVRKAGFRAGRYIDQTGAAVSGPHRLLHEPHA